MVETVERPTAKKVVDMNQYLLKGGKRNESWQVQTNGVFITHGGKRKQLQYSQGESSIFKTDHNKESKPTYIWFELGSLMVNPSDETKNAYLQTHPDFNKKYYLYSEESESDEALKILEAEDKIRTLLHTLDEDKREAVATVLFGMNVTRRWKPSKIKLELMRYAKSNPKKLRAAIVDPATELIFLTSGAIKVKVIYISADKTSVNWTDSGLEIIPIPRGVNPLQEMSTFLRTPEGLVTLQAIGDAVASKKGVKVPIKKPKK